MKKLLLTTLLATAVTTNATANGLLGAIGDSIATSGWETVKPTNKYQVEMNGFNTRVYEWRAKDGRKCIAMFSRKGTPTLDCD